MASGGPSLARVRSLTVATIVVAGAVFGGVQPVAAQDSSGNISGYPSIDAYTQDARYDPGQTGSLGVFLSNNATYDYRGNDPPQEAVDRAGEAQVEWVNISDTKSAPIEVRSDRNEVQETLPDGGESGPHNFDIVVDDDAEAGTYEVNVTTRYYHAENVSYNETSDGEYSVSPEENKTYVTRTDQVEIEINPQADFETEIDSNDVPLDGEGVLSLSIANSGDENVSDATVTVSSGDGEFYFGEGTATASANVGPWNESERKTIDFRAGTQESATSREYPIDVSVEYDDRDGNAQTDSTTIGVVPGQRDHFEVRDVDHDVPENGEGMLEVVVTQTTGKELSDVTVTATTTASDVYLGTEGSSTASTTVENWWSGKLVRPEFRVGTTADSADRSYPIELEFEYTDDDDNQNTRTKLVQFTPGDRSFFEIEDLSHDVPRDGEGTLDLEVEYTGEEDIEDVEATLSTEDSAVFVGGDGSAAATAGVSEWDGGDDETLTYRVGTTDAALEESYPLTVDFTYTDSDDNENSRTKYVEFVPEGGDQLAIEGAEHDVPVAGVGPVSVELSNTAGKDLEDLAVTATAQDSEIYLGTEGSQTGSASLERLPAGETRNVTFRVGATTNAVNRTYPLAIDVEYADEDDNQNTNTETVDFRPRAEPQIQIVDVDHDVPVGSTGLVRFDLRYDGPVNASEAVVTATSDTDAMFLGTGGTEPMEVQGVTLEPPETGTPTAQAFVGEWPAGETRSVYFRAGFDEDAIVRQYVTDLTIAYENEDGDSMPERTRSIGIEPLPEQEFTFDRVESDLYVGEEGDLLVNVSNGRDRPVEGVVVTAQSQEQNVDFYNSRHAVGSLGPGESSTASFRLGITEEAEPGPRVMEVSARYRDPQGDIQETDSRDVLVSIGDSRDAFDLAVESVAFAPGEEDTLEVTVTNQRNETLSDIQAQLFTDDPLDSEDDSAFIPGLDPGESETVVLDLSVAGSATEKTYSASMDFRFDNARGDSELTDTYRVPVTVAEGDSELGPLFLILVLLGLLGLIAAWRFGWFERVAETVNTRIR
ncbi:MAG: COG1361 S-layer family protein [Halodesulfurarchaeum sp.]